MGGGGSGGRCEMPSYIQITCLEPASRHNYNEQQQAVMAAAAQIRDSARVSALIYALAPAASAGSVVFVVCSRRVYHHHHVHIRGKAIRR
jgi:hypothetical protein